MKKTSSKPKQEGQNERHAQPHRQPQPNPQPNPQSQPQPQPHPQPHPQPQQHPQPHPQPQLNPQPQPNRQPQPNSQSQHQQRTAAAAAAAAVAAASSTPVVVVLPQSESSESTSTSTSSSSSTSRHEYGSGTVDTTSSSTSTAAFQTGRGQAVGRKRRLRYSDTVYPGRRKRPYCTNTGVMTEPESSKFWLYSVVAIVLTATTASAISMSLRAADAETDEPRHYVLPKQATTSQPPQCKCANGSGTSTTNSDVVPVDLRRLTTVEPQWLTTADGSDRGAASGPFKSGTASPDRAAAAGGGNATSDGHVGGEDASAHDGVPQQVAEKAPKSLVAYKIGPGRRKHGPRTSPTSGTPAKNDTGTRAARQVQTHANPAQPDSAARSRTTFKHATGTNEKTSTSKTTPLSSKTGAIVKHGIEEATAGKPERPPVNEYGDRQTPRAAAKTDVGMTSGELGGSTGATRTATGAQ
ncbi:uncharacterized protein [Dermacentor albipictus]|uniref:uncharacterized protein isoform X2 n=1 Tax=Dermacentor albipictus TaxID=60249 RepID=UPI0031FDC4DF